MYNAFQSTATQQRLSPFLLLEKPSIWNTEQQRRAIRMIRKLTVKCITLFGRFSVSGSRSSQPAWSAPCLIVGVRRFRVVNFLAQCLEYLEEDFGKHTKDSRKRLSVAAFESFGPPYRVFSRSLDKFLQTLLLRVPGRLVLMTYSGLFRNIASLRNRA